MRSLVYCLGFKQPHPQPAAHTTWLSVQLLGPHSAAEQSVVPKKVSYWPSNATIFYFSYSSILTVTTAIHFAFLNSPKLPQNKSAVEQRLSPKQVSFLPFTLPLKIPPCPPPSQSLLWMSNELFILRRQPVAPMAIQRTSFLETQFPPPRHPKKKNETVKNIVSGVS